MKVNDYKKVNICGVEVDNVTMNDALCFVDKCIYLKVKSFIVTPNVDHIVRFNKDMEFNKIYSKASLVLADGMPVVWASRFLGEPLKQKVSGSDLINELCEHSEQKQYKIFFLGGREGASEISRRIYELKYPNIKIVGHYSPLIGFEHDMIENQKIVDMINALSVDILFVGLGSPKQEKWIADNYENLKVFVCVGIGISFEYVSGLVKRAPRWMQHVGLEWFYRLCSEPKRLWKRYLVDDMVFFNLLIKDKFSRNRK